LALTIYLDASLLVALFTNDPFSARADLALRGRNLTVVVSDFAAAEFASAVARQVRTGELSRRDARGAFTDFDIWLARIAARAEIHSADIRSAEAALRRLDLTLRAPDAMNIAIAQRLGAELATFDRKMADCARALGVAVAVI
jgi:predicted nucleic acid-binding protein